MRRIGKLATDRREDIALAGFSASGPDGERRRKGTFAGMNRLDHRVRGGD